MGSGPALLPPVVGVPDPPDPAPSFFNGTRAPKFPTRPGGKSGNPEKAELKMGGTEKLLCLTLRGDFCLGEFFGEVSGEISGEFSFEVAALSPLELPPKSVEVCDIETQVESAQGAKSKF